MELGGAVMVTTVVHMLSPPSLIKTLICCLVFTN